MGDLTLDALRRFQQLDVVVDLSRIWHLGLIYKIEHMGYTTVFKFILSGNEGPGIPGGLIWNNIIFSNLCKLQEHANQWVEDTDNNVYFMKTT